VLDIRLIREQPDFVKQRLALVGCDAAQVEAVIDLDVRRRKLMAEVESIRAERRRASKAIGQMKPGPEQEAAKQEVRELGPRLAQLEKQLGEVEESFDAAMLELPNLPHDDVPPGAGEEENVVVRTEGRERRFDFEPLPHWELGERLGIIDFERGVKISGSRLLRSARRRRATAGGR